MEGSQSHYFFIILREEPYDIQTVTRREGMVIINLFKQPILVLRMH